MEYEELLEKIIYQLEKAYSSTSFICIETNVILRKDLKGMNKEEIELYYKRKDPYFYAFIMRNGKRLLKKYDVYNGGRFEWGMAWRVPYGSNRREYKIKLLKKELKREQERNGTIVK